MLASFSLILTFIVFVLLERVLSSPWERILKAIREDEDVVSTAVMMYCTRLLA